MTITIQHNGSLLISDIIKDEYIKEFTMDIIKRRYPII